MLVLMGAAAVHTAPNPTFSKEIASLLRQHCQECHRPGGLGPFPLLTFKAARPWGAE